MNEKHWERDRLSSVTVHETNDPVSKDSSSKKLSKTNSKVFLGNTHNVS